MACLIAVDRPVSVPENWPLKWLYRRVKLPPCYQLDSQFLYSVPSILLPPVGRVDSYPQNQIDICTPFFADCTRLGRAFTRRPSSTFTSGFMGYTCIVGGSFPGNIRIMSPCRVSIRTGRSIWTDRRSTQRAGVGWVGPRSDGGGFQRGEPFFHGDNQANILTHRFHPA